MSVNRSGSEIVGYPNYPLNATGNDDDIDSDRASETDPLNLYKDPHHSHHSSGREKGTPSYRSSFSVVATMAGAGVLGLPNAMKQSGWSGIALLFIVGIMANYTGKILIKSMYATLPRSKLRTYHAIGEAAFGKWGLYITLFLQNATLIAAGTLFLILAGDNAKALLENWFDYGSISLTAYIGGTALLVLPFIVGLKTMKEISIIAVGGMLATTFAVFVIVILSILHRPEHPSPKHTVFNAPTYPYAFATMVFAFGGHNVFPAIEDAMRTPRSFNKMFDSAFIAIFLLYLPPAIVGYFCFGDQTADIILANLEKGVVTDLATLAITLHIWFTIPIISNPVNLWIEEILHIEGRKGELLWRVSTRTGLLILQTGMAMGVPHFGDVMAFIGASCVSATVFFLPCIAYLKLYWHQVKHWEIVWIGLILMVATLGSTIGLYSAFVNIIQDVGHITLHIPGYVFWMILGIMTGVGFVGILIVLYLLRRHHLKNGGYSPIS